MKWIINNNRERRGKTVAVDAKKKDDDADDVFIVDSKQVGQIGWFCHETNQCEMHKKVKKIKQIPAHPRPKHF